MNNIKPILAALLLLCLAPMPYGYYQLVRIVSMIAFAIMAYQYYEKEEMPIAITFGGLALLFQPFIKVAHYCPIKVGKSVFEIIEI